MANAAANDKHAQMYQLRHLWRNWRAGPGTLAVPAKGPEQALLGLQVSRALLPSSQILCFYKYVCLGIFAT